ncbi:peptidoglycan-binding domain-containing protein [Streptomyces sp. 549]|uniref:peptidoglycan-binding domain-containing protein n=1 Tax=Streptomyces sp. 549 TaxID=3049076 RepID=UPI0024C27221|nr:peptidoglycan-binding domain-containing protein [Streptomyces sp. 549]MDK1473845.1 peptidoglycan-binding domain-containing protein [Streptomyces sp. 549]
MAPRHGSHSWEDDLHLFRNADGRSAPGPAGPEDATQVMSATRLIPPIRDEDPGFLPSMRHESDWEQAQRRRRRPLRAAAWTVLTGSAGFALAITLLSSGALPPLEEWGAFGTSQQSSAQQGAPGAPPSAGAGDPSAGAGADGGTGVNGGADEDAEPPITAPLPPAAPVPPQPEPDTVGGALQRGDTGPAVSDLQTRLSGLPSIYPQRRVDGTFDEDLSRAVAQYQTFFGITGDAPGVYGDRTRADLEART